MILGGDSPADILSLVSGGYEIADCRYGFKQGIDARGKVTTAVQGGMIDIILPQLPPRPLVDWALDSRKYTDGMIVTLDADNTPVEKIIFQNATCTYFKIDYLETGKRYLIIRMEITAERLILGSDGGITFTNNWVYD